MLSATSCGRCSIPRPARPAELLLRGLLPILTACAVLAFLGANVLAWAYGMPQPSLMPTFFTLSLAVIVFGAAASLIAYVAWIAIREREANPIPRVLAVVKASTRPEVLARRVAPVLLTVLCLSVFNHFKVFIPRINPFFL